MKYGILIGRFQPFHKGHEAIINKIKEDGRTPIVFIGSSQESKTERNPYSFEERRDIIKAAVGSDISVLPLPDYPANDAEWAAHIIKEASSFGDFKIYYHAKASDLDDVGLHYMQRAFNSIDRLDLLQHVEMQDVLISATDIRNTLKYVHASTLSYLGSNKFLKIKSYDRGDSKYYYAERLGKDSIAFILFDETTKKYGLVNEFKPPLDRFIITAFGGSLDLPLSKEEIVKRECLEESGYEAARVVPCGRRFVSTQMNQYCHLYLVIIGDKKERRPQDDWEEQACVVWVDKEAIYTLEDWKAQAILQAVEYAIR